MVKKWDYIIVIAVAIIGIVVGSFLDLTISTNLYYPSNAFGIIFAALGEAPGYALFALTSTLAFMLGLKTYKKWYAKAILMVLGVAGVILSIYFQADHITCKDGFNIPSLWYVGYLIALIVAGIGVLAGIVVFKYADTDNLLRIVIGLVIILAGAIIVVQLVKPIMDRPRFRFLMSSEGSLDLFCPWWKSGSEIKDLFPLVDSDEFKSFPSGHTNVAALTMPVLAFLPAISSKIKVNGRVLFYAGFAYTLIVALSRITVAAHFLSDVSFALLISILVYLVIDLLWFRSDKIYNLIFNHKKTNNA